MIKVIVFMIVFAIWVTTIVGICFSPQIIPIHWNAAGDVTRHASRWILTFFPVLSSFIMWLYLNRYCSSLERGAAWGVELLLAGIELLILCVLVLFMFAIIRYSEEKGNAFLLPTILFIITVFIAFWGAILYKCPQVIEINQSVRIFVANPSSRLLLAKSLGKFFVIASLPFSFCSLFLSQFALYLFAIYGIIVVCGCFVLCLLFKGR